jgi:hypothetical protein
MTPACPFRHLAVTFRDRTKFLWYSQAVDLLLIQCRASPFRDGWIADFSGAILGVPRVVWSWCLLIAKVVSPPALALSGLCRLQAWAVQ